MNLVSILSLIWPALFVIALLPAVLMTLSQFGYEEQSGSFTAVICFALLISLYTVPSIANLVRWCLSLIGFAAPLALGVISIQYLVEETSKPL